MYNSLFKDVILICGLSSSGKSSIANILCKYDSSYIKINTKKMNLISEEIICQKYFQYETNTASKIINRHISVIRELLKEAKEKNILSPVAKKVKNKLKKLSKNSCFEILYNCYKKELNTILQKKQKCIVDHNIFSDPYPNRKDIFFREINRDSITIVNLYTNIENIILNTLERNQRFYNFIENGFCQDELDNLDMKQGFSHIVFRQPLRILENISSMYKILDRNSCKAVQKISGKTFSKIIYIAHYEQEKLIGFLVYMNYPFDHIEDKELIKLRHNSKFLTKLNSKDVYITEKRFFYDFKLLTDFNFNSGKLPSFLNFSTNNILDLRTKHNSALLVNNVNKIWKRCKYNRTINTKGNNINFKDFLYNIYVIENFTCDFFSDEFLDILVNKKKKLIVIYPIANNVSSEVILDWSDPNKINIYILNPFLKEKFKEYDNNLIFLAKLYSLLKIKQRLKVLKIRVE